MGLVFNLGVFEDSMAVYKQNAVGIESGAGVCGVPMEWHVGVVYFVISEPGLISFPCPL